VRQFTTYQTGLEQVCPDSPEWYAQMAAFPLSTPERSAERVPACDARALQHRLYDEYRVEVPIFEWDGRQFVRVSVQGYNTEDDVEALVVGLRALIQEVHGRKD
jgi:isopenicillin-N epimerase